MIEVERTSLVSVIVNLASAAFDSIQRVRYQTCTGQPQNFFKTPQKIQETTYHFRFGVGVTIHKDVGL